MNGNFELNKPGWYTPKLVAENDFLNSKLESDTYGIYYSVLFEGDAETYLLQAKKAPVEGVKEWGHITESKSGKSMRFKRDKLEEGAPQSSASSVDNKYLKDTSDLPRSLVIELLKYYDVQTLYGSSHYEKMIKLAQSLNDDIMAMINANRSGVNEPGAARTPQPLKEEPKPAAAKFEFSEKDVPDFDGS